MQHHVYGLPPGRFWCSLWRSASPHFVHARTSAHSWFWFCKHTCQSTASSSMHPADPSNSAACASMTRIFRWDLNPVIWQEFSTNVFWPSGTLRDNHLIPRRPHYRKARATAPPFWPGVGFWLQTPPFQLARHGSTQPWWASSLHGRLLLRNLLRSSHPTAGCIYPRGSALRSNPAPPDKALAFLTSIATCGFGRSEGS